jgi:dolichol-phosphate mannosyltransferase
VGYEVTERVLISVLVPVYNEQGNIEPLYDAVNEALGVREDIEWEFVFTDNHSTDATLAELVELAERDDRVRFFRFSKNVGFQRSILAAYTKARGDVAVQIDCDLQDPPSMILEFLEAWEEGYDVVYGIRQSRQEGWLITIIRRVFYRVIDALSEDPLPHDAGDFRLVDRSVIDELVQLREVRPYLRGALATLGFEQRGIPYDRAARTSGESKFTVTDLFALAFDGILNHSIVPLRIATYTGLALALATVLGSLGYVVGRVWFGQDWPAGFATTTALLLVSLSVNSLFLGIIGEYLGRIFLQVRSRADAVVEYSIDATAGGESGRKPLILGAKRRKKTPRRNRRSDDGEDS